ncbi:MAG: flagellar hook-associated protein FlgL [Parasulfuritortus sp.]|jgi:flagellar hook-associated protein 3 FlgL|nr:flagellar hook-associated protein FlgL [Parasulfuritortus sp.]
MRISSSTFYSSSLGGILNQQSSISTLNQQIASGNKLLTAADDPVAASQVMSLNDRISLSTQYTTNQQSISQTQSEETTILNQIQKTLQSAQSALTGVSASNDQSTKNAIGATLSGLYQQIKDLANSQDTNGNYIFSGFQTSTQPYDGTSYNGDNGLRYVQIAQGQTVQANDNLNTVLNAGTGTTTGPTFDLLQTMQQTAAALQSTTTPVTSTQLTNAYTAVTGALSGLQDIQTSLVARQQQVQSQQTATQQLQATNQNALGNLSQLSDADKASAIVELQMRQTSLQAAESAFASTSKLSLFNYL